MLTFYYLITSLINVHYFLLIARYVDLYQMKLQCYLIQDHMHVRNYIKIYVFKDKMFLCNVINGNLNADLWQSNKISKNQYTVQDNWVNNHNIGVAIGAGGLAPQYLGMSWDLCDPLSSWGGMLVVQKKLLSCWKRWRSPWQHNRRFFFAHQECLKNVNVPPHSGILATPLLHNITWCWHIYTSTTHQAMLNID